MKSILLILTVLILAATAAWAGEADVETVEAVSAGENRYGFQVTIRHADAGWDHYADRFEIVDGGGRILGTRILYHPHVNEQPFTPQSRKRFDTTGHRPGYRAGPRQPPWLWRPAGDPATAGSLILPD